jgi:hypothetical protein
MSVLDTSITTDNAIIADAQKESFSMTTDMAGMMLIIAGKDLNPMTKKFHDEMSKTSSPVPKPGRKGISI